MTGRRRTGRDRRAMARLAPPRTCAALAVSHARLADQVAALTVVAVQLWELNNSLREALDLPREGLPLAMYAACAGWRGVEGA